MLSHPAVVSYRGLDGAIKMPKFTHVLERHDSSSHSCGPICQSHLQTPISILIQSLKALTNRDIDTYSKQCKPFTNQHFKQPPPDLSLLCASSPHSPSRRDCTLPQLQQFIVIGTPCSSSHHVLLSLYDCRR